MAAVGKFMHTSAHTGLTIALTNAFAAGTRHAVPLNQDQGGVNGSTRGVARLSALWVRVDTIAGASSITIRLSRDTAGDQPWIGDSTATLSKGITTATAGCVTFKIDVDYVHSDGTLYLHAKTDAGTCNVKAIELTWEE